VTDAVLLFWITIAQLCLYAIYRGRGSWAVVATMWIALGLATLTKGPIAIAVSFMTMLVLAVIDRGAGKFHGRAPQAERLSNDADPSSPCHPVTLSPCHPLSWWRSTRPLVGVILLALVIGPWLWLIHQRSPGFLDEMYNVFHKHVAQGTEQHWGPPGMHLLMIWGRFPVEFFPAVDPRERLASSPAAGGALCPGSGAGNVADGRVHRHQIAALHAAGVSTIGVLDRRCAAPLSARAISAAGAQGIPIRRRRTSGCLAGVGGSAMVSGAATVEAAPPAVGSDPPLERGGGLIRGHGILVLTSPTSGRALITMGLGTVALVAIAFGCYLPNAQFLRLPEQIGQCLIEQGAIHPGDAVMIQYKEGSIPTTRAARCAPKPTTRFFAKTPIPRVGPRGWSSPTTSGTAPCRPCANNWKSFSDSTASTTPAPSAGSG